MLTRLMALTKAQLKSKVQAIDASGVKGRNLRRKFEKIRNKQGGFTLLELLVVVAILAAIAGTATVMLQDTDRKASAAAHVAMMDELSKGIQTFRVMNGGKYPDNWDSLLQSATGTDDANATPLAILSKDLTGSISQGAALSKDEAIVLDSVGITKLRMVSEAACGATAELQQKKINDKSNDVTAQNIYRTPAANGCGVADSISLAIKDATSGDITGAAAAKMMYWTADKTRVGVASDDTDAKLVAFGVGPDSTLFNPATLGALSNVPVYRHVEPDEYNRFVVLFKVAGQGVNGQATFQAIVDGAGDTKDEELGEVDNVRST